MARKTSITKEMILDAGVDYVTSYGIQNLNVRSLAAHLGCSIQPIFKNFGTMEACKAEIVHALEGIYREYIDSRVDDDDHMFTISLAHIQLARDNRHLFEIIFQAGLYHVRTVDEVVKEQHNRPSIDSIVRQYGISIEAAEAVYRDVRFYSLGIAQGVYAGSVRFNDGECEQLLRNAINKFVGQ